MDPYSDASTIGGSSGCVDSGHGTSTPALHYPDEAWGQPRGGSLLFTVLTWVLNQCGQ